MLVTVSQCLFVCLIMLIFDVVHTEYLVYVLILHILQCVYVFMFVCVFYNKHDLHKSLQVYYFIYKFIIHINNNNNNKITNFLSHIQLTKNLK